MSGRPDPAISTNRKPLFSRILTEKILSGLDELVIMLQPT